MNISQNGIDFIKKFEGLELKAYKPVAEEKFFTIGYGHSGSDVRQGEVITAAQAESILKQDLAIFVQGVNNLLKVPVNQNQADALYSFAYNIGVQGLGASTLLRDVNAKEFDAAANEFGRWVHGANGKVLQGLVNRRKAEATLFSTPVKPPEVYYTVVKGDYLGKIASKYSTTVDSICRLSKINPKSILQIGQKVRVK